MKRIEAEKKGRAAARAGKHRKDNPYKGGWVARWWDLGWCGERHDYAVADPASAAMAEVDRREGDW